jgi:sugar phosphate permease
MRINPPISNNIFMLFSLLVAKIINLEMVMSKTIRMFALFLMKC